MRLRYVAVVALAAVASIGTPQVTPLAVYDTRGTSFRYPARWRVLDVTQVGYGWVNPFAYVTNATVTRDVCRQVGRATTSCGSPVSTLEDGQLVVLWSAGRLWPGATNRPDKTSRCGVSGAKNVSLT